MLKTVPILNFLEKLQANFKPTKASDIKDLNNQLVLSGIFPKTRSADSYLLLRLLELSDRLTKDSNGTYILSSNADINTLRRSFETHCETLITEIGAHSLYAQLLHRIFLTTLENLSYLNEKELDAYDFFVYIKAKAGVKVGDAEFKKYVIKPIVFLGYVLLIEKSKQQISSETSYLNYFRSPFLSRYGGRLYKYVLKPA